MRSEVTTITPEIARAMLSLNTGNRHLRKGAVRGLANAITRGEWKLTPQGISISSKGVLMDGQHRLEAIALSGVPCPMVVWNDVDPEAFGVIDQGITRTLGDAAQIPAKQTEVMKFLHYQATGGSARPTVAQIKQINEKIGPIVERLMTYAPKASKSFTRVGIRAACVLLVAEKNDEARIFDIYRRLTLGDLEGMPSIVMAFVKQILNGTASKGDGGAGQTMLFCKALTALDSDNELRKVISFTDAQRDDARNRVRKILK